MYDITLLLLYGSVILAVGLLATIALRKRRKVFPNGKRFISPELQVGAVPTFKRTLPQISAELTRVRRYNRPMTIVVLRIESDQLLVDLRRGLLLQNENGRVNSYNYIIKTIQLVFSLVGSLLIESLRDSDIATYDVAANQYIIALPECDRAQAMQTVQRLKLLLFKRTAGHLVEGVAEFPTDGLIIEDLVKHAVELMNQKTGIKAQPQVDVNGHFELRELETVKEN